MLPPLSRPMSLCDRWSFLRLTKRKRQGYLSLNIFQGNTWKEGNNFYFRFFTSLVLTTVELMPIIFVYFSLFVQLYASWKFWISSGAVYRASQRSKLNKDGFLDLDRPSYASEHRWGGKPGLEQLAPSASPSVTWHNTKIESVYLIFLLTQGSLVVSCLSVL